MKASNQNPKIASRGSLAEPRAALLCLGRRAALALWISASAIACGTDDNESGPNPGSTPALDASSSPVGTGNPSVSSDAGGAPEASAPSSGSARDAGASSVRDAGAQATSDAGSASATGGDATAASPEAGTPSAGGACTREMLAAAVDGYYKALSAHDAKMMNAASTIKLSEDGKTIMAGEGLMKTAGMVKFKRSALDTLQCETVTESVVENSGSDYVVGTRLKVSAGQITEVESILVGPDGWFPNPKAIIDSKTDDWEKPLLAEAERWPRDKLKKDIVDAYFVGVFGGKIKVADFPFASDCKRSENGFSPGACNFGVPTSMPMTPLHYVVDVEAGIAAGFVLFGGKSSGMDDFHMFRVKSGKVTAVHAVVGPSVMGRGWPSDPAGTP